MAKCFTCGRRIDPDAVRYKQQSKGGLFPSLYTCTHCENLKVLKDVRQHAQEQVAGFTKVGSQIDNLSQIQTQGFRTLQNELQSGFAGVQSELRTGFAGVQNELQSGFSGVHQDLAQLTSVVEWGLQDINWHVSQQTDVLRSIDQTLKTPLQTQANELRQMAEELFNRGVLDEAESRFRRVIDMNPLDYRGYVGLAHVYIAEGDFDEAKKFLENSLAHAPKREFDYKSYSYRLIGRIFFCKEDNPNAVGTLRQAVDLSPNYAEAHYDFAQYAALVGDKNTSLAELANAISLQPQYWLMAKAEPNFEAIRAEVATLLSGFASKAAAKAQIDLDLASKSLDKIEAQLPSLNSLADAADRVGHRLNRTVDRTQIRQLESSAKAIRDQLHIAGQAIKADDYLSIPNAQQKLGEVLGFIAQTDQEAMNVQQYFGGLQNQFTEAIESLNDKKRKEAHNNAIGCANSIMSLGWIGVAVVAFFITRDVFEDGRQYFIVFPVLLVGSYGIIYMMRRILG